MVKKRNKKNVSLIDKVIDKVIKFVKKNKIFSFALAILIICGTIISNISSIASFFSPFLFPPPKPSFYVNCINEPTVSYARIGNNGSLEAKNFAMWIREYGNNINDDTCKVYGSRIEETEFNISNLWSECESNEPNLPTLYCFKNFNSWYRWPISFELIVECSSQPMNLTININGDNFDIFSKPCEFPVVNI